MVMSDNRSPLGDNVLVSLTEELEILRIKYERLLLVCETLLKPWPSVDAISKGTDVPTISPSSATPVHIEKYPQRSIEIQSIDKILETAQKLRIAEKQEQDVMKSVPILTTSIKQAKSVYSKPKATLKGLEKQQRSGKKDSRHISKSGQCKSHDQMIGSNMKPSKHIPKSGEHKSHDQMTGSGMKPSKHIPKSGEHKSHDQMMGSGTKHMTSTARDANMVDIQVDDRSCYSDIPTRTDNTRRDYNPETEKSLDSQRFTLQCNGTTLSMPSKYYKLKKEISRICGTFSEEEFSAEQFLSNVCVRDEDNEEASKHIDLILLRDELQLLNDSFSDISIQELSITERHPLKEAVRLKMKFELLTQRAKQLYDNPECGLSSQVATGNLEMAASPEQFSQYLKLNIENYFIQYCVSNLLPLLHQTDPSHREYPLLIQTIQRLTGLKQTIFVSLVSLKNP